MNNKHNELLEEALALAEAGFPVIPCVPGEKGPVIPKSEGGCGVYNATLDEAIIHAWWTRWPNANIGLPLGKVSGLIGIDVDYKDGCRRDFLDSLPPTVTVCSPSGGHHAYFKYTPDIPNGFKIENGATVRSDGYLLVVPPSFFNAAGTFYTYLERLSTKFKIYDGTVAEISQWVIGAAKVAKEKKEPFIPEEEVIRGNQNEQLFKMATSLRGKGMSKIEVLAGLVALNERANPRIPQEELEEMATRVCKAYVKGGEGKTKIKAQKENNDAAKKKRDTLNALGKEILDVRFKLEVGAEKTVLYNITNIDKKELEVCVNEEFLLKRLSTNLLEKTGEEHRPDVVAGTYSAWRMQTGTIPSPKTFTWGDEDGWCFKKLGFTPTEGAYTSWEEFLNRLSSRSDFMAYIWSLFELKNKSRQFLYLYDLHGEGGKSTIIRVLGDVFGNAFTSLSNSMVTGGGNRWLMGQLYGKRLVAWSDCKNPKICMSELLRNITSGDPVPVEFKGQPPFQAVMYCKLIIGSNHEPQITGGGADTSRLLCIHVEENSKKDDPLWEARLGEELPSFLYACRQEYLAKCPHHGKIQLEESTRDNADHSTMDLEINFEVLADKRLKFGSECVMKADEWTALCGELFDKDAHAVHNFKEFLIRRGVSFKRVRQNGRKLIECRGMEKIKDFWKRPQPLDAVDGVGLGGDFS